MNIIASSACIINDACFFFLCFRHEVVLCEHLLNYHPINSFQQTKDLSIVLHLLHMCLLCMAPFKTKEGLDQHVSEADHSAGKKEVRLT